MYHVWMYRAFFTSKAIRNLKTTYDFICEDFYTNMKSSVNQYLRSDFGSMRLLDGLNISVPMSRARMSSTVDFACFDLRRPSSFKSLCNVVHDSSSGLMRQCIAVEHLLLAESSQHHGWSTRTRENRCFNGCLRWSMLTRGNRTMSTFAGSHIVLLPCP